MNDSICFVTQLIWFRCQLCVRMKRPLYKFPFGSLPKQLGIEANFEHEANTEYYLISFDTLVGKNSGVAFTHPPPSAIMSHFIIKQRCYFLLRYSIGLDCTFACTGTGPLDRVLYLGSDVLNSTEEGVGTDDVSTGTSPES